MVITYHGGEFFKVQFGDTVVAFNPVSKDSKLKGTRFGADICFVSLNHPDFNGADQVVFGDKIPFTIQGPGEYEIKGVFIKGFESKSNYGGTPRLNTIYLMNLDSMNVCFLGALGVKDLPTEIVEGLGEIDILFVPIGGEGTLSPADAYKLAVSLEPKMIIPMHYTPDALKQFLKEGGVSGEEMDKLTVKRKDLDGKEGQITVLSAQ